MATSTLACKSTARECIELAIGGQPQFSFFQSLGVKYGTNSHGLSTTQQCTADIWGVLPHPLRGGILCACLTCNICCGTLLTQTLA